MLSFVCRYCGKDLIQKSSASKDIDENKYIIKLRASEQLKMINYIVKEFTKDIAIPFDEAEKALLKGCI